MSDDRIRFGLLFEVFRTEHVTGRFVQKALEPTGVRGDDYAVYSALLRGPMTLTRLAEQTGMPLTTAAGYVKRLDAQGHIERTPNPDDGRSQLLALTPECREWLAGVRETFTDAVAHLDRVFAEAGIDSSRLLDELEVIQGHVERALESLEAERRDQPG